MLELDWPHSTAHFSKPPIGCKDLGDISYRIRITAMATSVSRGKILLAVLDGPTTKNPHKHKDRANISSRNRVIGHFVRNFIAMATRKGQGKISLAAFNGSTPKTLL